MFKHIRPALVSFSLLTLLTGVLYPLAVTGVAKMFFSHEARGSVMTKDGQAIGSELIGQPFSEPKYFWSRPSATSPNPYAGNAGSGSNLGSTNPALADLVKQRTAALHDVDPDNTDAIPADLVTASASGLDPHISVAAANYQIARIARVRGLDVMTVSKIVEQNIEARTLGLLGGPRLNVLKLNLALDHPAPATRPADAADNSPVLTRWPMSVK